MCGKNKAKKTRHCINGLYFYPRISILITEVNLTFPVGLTTREEKAYLELHQYMGNFVVILYNLLRFRSLSSKEKKNTKK